MVGSLFDRRLRSDHFPFAQTTLPWQHILARKLAKSAYSPLFVALAFGNWLQYRTFDSNLFIYDDVATSCKTFGELRSSNSRVLTLRGWTVYVKAPKFCHITPILRSLQWLRITDSETYWSWLFFDKVLSQDVKKETPLQFRFSVRFYPEDVAEELIQDITRVRHASRYVITSPR